LWVTADVNRASRCRESGFQQLQVSSPQMSPQMAAESMLIGTALTADITGVVPDHRRGDRSADRPPVRLAACADLQGGSRVEVKMSAVDATS